MDDRLASFIEETHRAMTRDEVGRLLKSRLSYEGFENLALIRTNHDHRITELVWLEAPDGYGSAYLANRWDLVDPVFEHALVSSRPFSWENSIDRNSPKARRQFKFMRDCEDLGVHSGMTVPLHGPGLTCDMLSVSARTAGAERPGLGRHVNSLALHAWMRMGELERPRDVGPKLTHRELEVLRWVKDGKTNAEVGEVMKLSSKTVEYHLLRAMKKLSAPTRTRAVAEALSRGMIAL